MRKRVSSICLRGVKPEGPGVRKAPARGTGKEHGAKPQGETHRWWDAPEAAAAIGRDVVCPASIVQAASHRLKSRRRSTTPQTHTGKNDLKRGASDAQAFGQRWPTHNTGDYLRASRAPRLPPEVGTVILLSALAAEAIAYRDHVSGPIAPQ